MNDFSSFLSPLPQDGTIPPRVNGRVHLPSLQNVFPFEETPPFLIGKDLTSFNQKEERTNRSELNNEIRTSNEMKITNFINYNEPNTKILNPPVTNKTNNIYSLNTPQQRQRPSFPHPQGNYIYNISNHETTGLIPVQNSTMIDSCISNGPIPSNYQNYNHHVIQPIPPPIQIQTPIRPSEDQYIQDGIIVNNVQPYMPSNQSNSIIFQQPQQQSIKVQDVHPYQLYTPVNSQMLKPVVNHSIDYPMDSNASSTGFFMKPMNNYKPQQTNLALSKVPIYSFRMRSNRRYSEKELLDITINPIELNFLPKEFWLTPQTTIKQVVQGFFKARSTKNLRFEHKLWNALILATHYPELISILGIYWISLDILKVNRDIFGALINVTKPAAALFNSQGSFLTHGFVEVSKEEALKVHMIKEELVEDVDESVVRLFRHSAGLLKANSHKGDLVTCRWNK